MPIERKQANSTQFIDRRANARELRYVSLRKLADEAMSDPLFVQDMRDTMAAFEAADADGWPGNHVGNTI